MHIILHDFDRDDLKNRGWALQVALPDAEIHGFSTRRGVLRYIARLPSPGSGPKPLALIDIQHHDRQVRGWHLMQTISRHPALRDNVAMIAFSQFHSVSRNHQLEAIGARGALNPLHVGAAAADPENRPQLASQLQRCASGESRTVELGAAPSLEEDMKFLQSFTEVVPDLDRHHDRGVALEEALAILTICRMKADGIEDKDILKSGVAGFSDRRDLKRLAEERLDAEALARIPEAVSPGALSVDLGAVARHMARSKDHSDRRAETLEADRKRLYTQAEIALLNRAKGVLGEFDDDGKLIAIDPEQDGAYIPPEDVPLLTEFFDQYLERRRLLSKPKPSTGQIAGVSEETIAWMAERHGAALEEMRDRITHAYICLEDLLHDDKTSEDEPAGERNFRG